MADITFGVVGIASFAIQLADSIKKLQSFIAKVKNARVELDEILTNLKISQQWLDSLKNVANPAAGIDPTLMAACEQLCRRAVDRIKETVNELNISMQIKKHRTAIKFAWGTEEMERLLQKLETSKTDLHHAHSIYYFEEMRFRVSEQGRQGRDLAVDLNADSYARDEILKDNVANMQAGQAMLQQTINTGQQAIQRNFTHMQTTQMHLRQELQISHQVQQRGIGSLQMGQTTLQRALHIEQAQLGEEVRLGTTLITSHLDASLAAFSAGILNAIQAQTAPGYGPAVVSGPSLYASHSPKRLHDKCCQRATQARHHWARQYQLRLWSRVWHITICHAWSGWEFALQPYSIIPRVDERWEVICSKDIASIQRAMFDKFISPYDRDELGYTTMDIIMLVGHDASFILQLYDLWTAARMPLVLGVHSEYTIHSMWSVSRERDSVDEHGRLLRAWLDSPGFTADSADDIMDVLVKQPSTWTTDERLQLVDWGRNTDDCEALIFDTLVSFDMNLPARATTQRSDGFTMLHALALSYVGRRVIEEHSSRLDELLQAHVHSGSDLHPVWQVPNGTGYTPLVALYSHCRRQKDNPEDIIQSWVKILRTAGVDLEKYGRAEMDAFRCYRDIRFRFNDILVTYGPEVQDWNILEMHPGHCYAGLFWHMIEHPEETIPGAWLEEDDLAVRIEDSLVRYTRGKKGFQRAKGALGYYARWRSKMNGLGLETPK
ncbi:hypothetical protein LTR27_010011 [Elasticomyces elasticus]|nr:hypothetical protein LTR27_010011 [Elasticomyces elasticus]